MSTPPLAALFDLIATLRGPDGCPWDRKQKFEDVLSDLIEEAYELEWASHEKPVAEVLDEMGDVLFLVCFAIAIRHETDPGFEIGAIADHAYRKIYSRHPHVFGDKSADTPEESIAHWEEAKARERQDKDASAHTLDGIAGNLPPLRHAEKVQERAAATGFDWDDARDVVAKLREEADELERAVTAGDSDHVAAELGDVFFAAVNVARFLNLDADAAARRGTAKFIRRFNEMESRILADGRSLKAMTLEEMDAYWDRVKADE